MSGGYLGGFLMGAVLSAGAAAVIVGLAGPPPPPKVGIDAPAADAAPPDSPGVSGRVPRSGDAEPLQSSTPVVDAPQPDAGQELTAETTRTADRPQAGEAASDIAEPAARGGANGVALDGDALVSTSRQPAAPTPPGADSQAAIPAQPQRTPLSRDGARGVVNLRMPELDRSEDPEAPEAETTVTNRGGSAAAPDAPDRTVDPDITAEPAPRPQTDADGSAGIAETSEADAPTAPRLSGSATTGTAPGSTAPPDPADGDAPPRAPGDPVAPNAGEGRAGGATLLQMQGQDDPADSRAGPSIGTPATSLLDRGGAADGNAPSGDAGAPPEAAAAPADRDQPALQRHAGQFENSNGLPLMSIILTDTGQNLDDGPVGLAALGSFPYPLSFAVDTSLPDAAERAARYRADGHEVLALVNLPPNLAASDTEVAMTALLARLPQAVAVLEGFGTGLQGSTEMSEQVSAILQETGHGVVWQPKGFDTAAQSAARAGVASDTLLGTFGDDDQSPMVIRRGLDQSAFRATQQGAAILVGPARPDTITALILWGLQDRAQRVAVAPVSAVLMQGQEDG